MMEGRLKEFDVKLKDVFYGEGNGVIGIFIVVVLVAVKSAVEMFG